MSKNNNMAQIVWINSKDDNKEEEDPLENANLNESNLTSELPKTSNMPMDMNIYATRKTVAQGMMDIALMTANASQLKYVLLHPLNHNYFEVTIILITLSIILQIIVGILLIFLGRWNINYRGDHRKADMANNLVIIIIFLITVVNVMISSFGPNGPSNRFPTYSINQNNLPSGGTLTFKMREPSKL